MSLAGFTFWEVKVRLPRENAAARALDVDDVDEAFWYDVICVEEASPLEAPAFPRFVSCRCNCSAFARAFSCVRTNCARFYRDRFSQPYCVLYHEHEADLDKILSIFGRHACCRMRICPYARKMSTMSINVRRAGIDMWWSMHHQCVDSSQRNLQRNLAISRWRISACESAWRSAGSKTIEVSAKVRP